MPLTPIGAAPSYCGIVSSCALSSWSFRWADIAMSRSHTSTGRWTSVHWTRRWHGRRMLSAGTDRAWTYACATIPSRITTLHGCLVCIASLTWASVCQMASISSWCFENGITKSSRGSSRRHRGYSTCGSAGTCWLVTQRMIPCSLHTLHTSIICGTCGRHATPTACCPSLQSGATCPWNRTEWRRTTCGEAENSCASNMSPSRKVCHVILPSRITASTKAAMIAMDSIKTAPIVMVSTNRGTTNRVP